MLESHPARSPGVAAGYALIAGLLLLDTGLLALLLSEPINSVSFLWGALLVLSLPAMSFILYWTVALGRARYVVREGALTIDWGPLHHVIPLHEVRAVLSGVGEGHVARFRGVRWPGYLLGWGQVLNHPRVSGTVFFFATRPLPQQLLVLTGQRTYALTPEDPERFRASLEALLAVAGNGDRPEGDRPTLLVSGGWLSWPIWRDVWGQGLLLLGLLLDALLFLFLTILYPRLQEALPLQVDLVGTTVRSGPARRLFLLPLFGLLAWLFDAPLGWFFYRRRNEPVVAYLVWASAAVVQIGAWVAIVFLVWREPN